MAPDNLHTGKQPAKTTDRDASRRLLMLIIPLAVLAVVVLLLGYHFTGSIK